MDDDESNYNEEDTVAAAEEFEDTSDAEIEGAQLLRDDDDDDDDNDEEEPSDMKFGDFTMISHSEEESSRTDTILMAKDFTQNTRLAEAKPGTWLYSKILDSTPLKASSILTQYLDVQSLAVAYMMPNSRMQTAFYSKNSATSRAHFSGDVL